MKILVFLLVLANLLFYAYGAGYFGVGGDNPDAGRMEQQFKPERMRIVSRGEPPAKAEKPLAEKAEAVALPAQEASAEAANKAENADEAGAKPTPAPASKTEAPTERTAKPEAAAKPAPATVCLAWDRIGVADADRVSNVLSERFPAFRQTRRAINAENANWWVYMTPLGDKAWADKKAGELRALGVTDFFLVQEGPNRNAISLGVFSAEKGAQERLADLRTQGVRSARISVRPGKEGLLRLEATGPGSARDAVLALAQRVLPKPLGENCQ